jgi:hypothetical protein
MAYCAPQRHSGNDRGLPAPNSGASIRTHMRKAVVHRRAGAAANWLGPPFRPLWLEATRALFKETSCESLKLTRRLADLVFSAQLTIAASPTRAEGRRILNEIDDLLTKAAVLIDSHDVRTLAPAVADSLAEKGASSGRVLARVARLAAQAALDSTSRSWARQGFSGHGVADSPGSVCSGHCRSLEDLSETPGVAHG